jgi:hypothetical protein
LSPMTWATITFRERTFSCKHFVLISEIFDQDISNTLY